MAEQANDVKAPVETETTATEPSTEKTNDDGVIILGESEPPAETKEEDAGNDSPEAATAADEPTEGTKSEVNDDAPRKNAETRKQQLNNEIRDKVAERNALQREIAELNRQKYEMKNTSDLPTVDALLNQINPETGDYYTRTEAKLARIEAERELEKAQSRLDKYTEEIVDNRMRLKDEADRALKDFPIFDENSSSYNQELTKQADKIAEGLIVKDDKTGEIIGARGSVYGVYAAIASAAQSAKADGEVAGRKAALNMANSADIVGSNSISTASDDDDPFLKGMLRGMD